MLFERLTTDTSLVDTIAQYGVFRSSLSVLFPCEQPLLSVDTPHSSADHLTASRCRCLRATVSALVGKDSAVL